MVEGNGEITAETVFDHPTRLKLYLHLRRQKEPVGIRETQRNLNISSPSTVSWHLDKLVEHEYVMKTLDNRYFVDPKSSLDSSITVQVSFTVQLFRDRLVTPLTFILYFLLLMLPLTFFVWMRLQDPIFIGLQGLFSLLISLAVIIYFYQLVKAEILELESPENLKHI